MWVGRLTNVALDVALSRHRESLCSMNCHTRWMEDTPRPHVAGLCSVNHSKHAAEKHHPRHARTLALAQALASSHDAEHLRRFSEPHSKGSFTAGPEPLCLQQAWGPRGRVLKNEGAPSLHVWATPLFHFSLCRHP